MSDEKNPVLRHPIILYVDKVEISPITEMNVVTRTVYDLELTEYDVKKLYEGIKQRMDSNLPKAMRIRVIGRLVS
jgi:hypothetical protein